MKEKKQYKDKRLLKKTTEIKNREFIEKCKDGTIDQFIDKFIYDAF